MPQIWKDTRIPLAYHNTVLSFIHFFIYSNCFIVLMIVVTIITSNKGIHPGRD